MPQQIVLPSPSRNACRVRARALAAPLPWRLAGLCVLAGLTLFAPPPAARAQAQDTNAQRIVRQAVASELASDANDHTAWIYQDHDVQPDHDTVSRVVDTPNGGMHRMIQNQGRPLSASEEAAESDRIVQYLHDRDAQNKDRKNSAHDDAQAAAMLRMLPDAFIWTVRSETPQFVTLDYRPNPDFSPPNLEAKVMGAMAGQMVVRRPGDHIYTLKGRLTQDVHIGFGLVKMHAGGTFDVERREIAPGHWQIVEQHTHILGHALLFKTISEQEDEWKTEFKPSPAQNLKEAAALLGVNTR